MTKKQAEILLFLARGGCIILDTFVYSRNFLGYSKRSPVFCSTWDGQTKGIKKDGPSISVRTHKALLKEGYIVSGHRPMLPMGDKTFFVVRAGRRALGGYLIRQRVKKKKEGMGYRVQSMPGRIHRGDWSCEGCKNVIDLSPYVKRCDILGNFMNSVYSVNYRAICRHFRAWDCPDGCDICKVTLCTP